MFGVALFCLWTNRHKKLRSLENNVLEAFKISRFCFFDLRGDLGGPEASELENREKKPTRCTKYSWKNILLLLKILIEKTNSANLKCF